MPEPPPVTIAAKPLMSMLFLLEGDVLLTIEEV
jgi:hypothetical protein